ncbi:MAG TPA: ACP S-malonyltransferase [Chlamydiales bacterium]|nr:ACP S-malonyltransferase [Chlamydiales bacterium]
MSKNAYLFPGQGAQYPGMGRDFALSFSVSREIFEEADELLQERLSRIIFEGPEDLLTQTRYSQIGIFITSVAILKAIETQFPELKPSVCAGLSLGEYTALYASERISFQDALLLVQKRAQLMNKACQETSGTMAAVIGLGAEKIEEALSSLHDVWIANYNCPGQIVISGTKDGVEQAAVRLKSFGAKLASLRVHGAFHSGLMQLAKEGLAPAIQHAKICQSQVGLCMNVPGDFVHSVEEIRAYLIDQVTQSVRWEQGIRSMEGIELFFEIGCGKTLAGLNKKIGVAAPTLSIEKVADLERIEGMLCRNY